MLWASLIVIQGFVMGQALLPPQGDLTLFQGIVVIGSAAAVMAIFMVLNGQAGLKYGIPYCIQLRASYGTRGARFPEVIRVVPALIWYGFGTWIAALSMDSIVKILTGFSAPGIKFLYFIALQVFQTWLAYHGVRVMKWFNVCASVALVLIMSYMLLRVVQTQGFEIAKSWQTDGTWGWAFWSGLNATIGILVTVLASASDLTRYLENKQSSAWLGHLLGVAPPLFFMMFMGFVAAVTTGVWDPIQALMQLSPSPTLMLLLLFFILIAQFSTNLTINILPPAFIFEELFGINWHKGVILAGVLGSFTFPWVLLESGENFIRFINYYTAFFGPLLGCMLAEYWLERSDLDIEQLYVSNSSSKYWYKGGVNWAGVFTTLGVAVYVMIWWLEISWLVGLPLGLVSYTILRTAMSKLTRESENVPS
jgi:NCS1 family nucleobase:cation symporter-1